MNRALDRVFGSVPEEGPLNTHFYIWSGKYPIMGPVFQERVWSPASYLYGSERIHFFPLYTFIAQCQIILHLWKRMQILTWDDLLLINYSGCASFHTFVPLSFSSWGNSKKKAKKKRLLIVTDWLLWRCVSTNTKLIKIRKSFLFCGFCKNNDKIKIKRLHFIIF